MTPTQVKVGCLTYRVSTDRKEIKRHSEEADLTDDAEWGAFSNHDKLLIGINPDAAPAVQRRDLLHEVLHCCLRLAGVWPNQYAEIVGEARRRHGGYDVEEYTIAAMSGPLLGVLRDNPDLTKWLKAG